MLHGVVHQAADGRIIAMNPAAERILGKTREELLGSTSGDVEHDTIREDGTLFPASEHPAMVALATGVAVRGVLMGVYNPREQQHRWIRINAVPLVGDGGAANTNEVYTVFEDVTDLRATEQALKRSEAHFRSIVEHTPDVHLRTDAHTGRDIYVSPSCTAVFGMSADALMQETPEQRTQRIHPDDRAIVAAATLQVDVSGREEIEFRSRRHGDTYRWFWAVMTVVRDDRGTVVYRDAILRDITDRKNAELALREADELKNRFIATLAHELRNPLAPLGNAASLLEHDLDPARLAWCRDMIGRQVGQMSRLLDGLLDVSRITLGKVTLHREPVDLSVVIDHGIEMARPLIDKQGHQLIVDLPDVPLPLVGDPVRLAQICCNLLTNAAKYTNVGGRIVIRVSHDGINALLEVEDTGVGLAPDDLERVFLMFSQLDETRPRAGDGLGIGLALVKGMVELHGGQIKAQSAGRGKGSTFAVWLPLATAG